jgi:hypothetical protein
MHGFSEFEWEIKDSKNGEKTLLLGGRAVYSLYNPTKHVDNTARELIKKATEKKCDHIIIIGLGLGYLPRSLYNLGYKKIIVWEPFPVMQQSFPLCSGEWKEVVIITNNYSDFKKATLHFARKGAKPKLIVHPGYEIFCRLEYRLAIQLLEKIYNNNRTKYVVSKRALESLVRIPFLGTVKDFEGVFKGKKAILTNPGPSLKECVSILKNVNDSIIFASLQSAPFLQKNGVKVNFIVCLDPKDMNSFLDDCSNDFDAFFAETCVDPSTLDWNSKKTYLFHLISRQIHEKLWKQARLPVIDDPISSVSEVMLLLADYMGFSEIYCIGMDLCWKDNRYSYRTQYRYDNDPRVNDMMSQFKILTNDNQIANTQSVYFHAARYMQYKCPELIKSGKRIYQMKGGIDFYATDKLSIEELERRLLQRNEEISLDIKRPQSPVTVEQVKKLLNSIKNNKVTGQKNNSNTGSLNLWPFLKQIPDTELYGICEESLSELNHLALSYEKI